MASITRSQLLSRQTYLSSSIFFFRHLPSELAERNSTETDHMLGSECDLKTNARNVGYPLPYKSGAPRAPFSTTSQFSGNGLYLRNETWQTIRQVRWRLEGFSCIVLKRHERWSANGLKLYRHFYPPNKILHSDTLPDFADGDQQTELNQTLPNGG